MRAAKLTCFNGRRSHYTSVRFVRSLIYSHGRQSPMTDEEWLTYLEMGDGPQDGARKYHLTDPEEARKCCLAISTRAGNIGYTFADLACFLCLSTADDLERDRLMLNERRRRANGADDPVNVWSTIFAPLMHNLQC